MKSYKIVTFGCQMNLADSGSLAAVLNARGFHPAETEVDADIVILNTCSVREKAEDRVFGRLGELYGMKKTQPGKKIAVVGCMSQRLGEKILQRAPYVDIVLGTDRMLELPQYVDDGAFGAQVHTEFGYEEIDGLVPVRDNKFAAFLTIMRGCNQYCTYCIVPYVRGEERSYPLEKITFQVNQMVQDGVKEITFLGQNVNSYNDGRHDFADLLRAVARNTDIKRIRFMTSHPKDLSDRLIDVVATEPKMMAHLHLPMQSGSNRILRRMGRIYTYEHFLNLIHKMRAAVADIAISTDLIVGFCSETEEDFQMTLRAVEEIRFDSAFMFRYSPRQGTAAYRLPDDIPDNEKIRRLSRLINLQKRISFEKNQEELGKSRSVLVDGFSRRSQSVLKGKTEGNKTVLFTGPESLIGAIKTVRITSADAWTLHGELEN